MSSSSHTPQPPCPWRDDGTAATPSTSDLLKRVKDFLPQIQAANENATGRRLDQGLVVDDKAAAAEDDSDDALQQADEDTKPMAKKQRTKDKSDDDGDDEESSAVPTIQLDLTLGVDANHPAMALLGKSDDDNKDKNAETMTAENDDEQNLSKAEQAVQSLLNRPKVAANKAKGPLITEVKED